MQGVAEQWMCLAFLVPYFFFSALMQQAGRLTQLLYLPTLTLQQTEVEVAAFHYRHSPGHTLAILPTCHVPHHLLFKAEAALLPCRGSPNVPTGL